MDVIATRLANKLQFRPYRAALAIALAALMLALWSSNTAFAATIAADDFEGGNLSGGAGWLDAWQTSGSVDVVTVGSPQAGAWHMRLRSGNGVAYRDVDLAGWSSPELVVWVKAKSFEGGDYASLRVGPPGSLVEARRWSGGEDDDDEDDEYHLFTFALSNTVGAFRIQFESHMDSASDELYVDALAISDDQPPEEAAPIPTASPPASAIALDGEFSDWAGRANISDAAGDARNARGDILRFYWGDNDGDERMYWMVERPAGFTNVVSYSVHLDMNNDGDFHDDVDRIVEARYHPRNDDSHVDVKVRRADNNRKLAEYKHNDWGESRPEGGGRVEFGVPFSDLGFSFGAAFRMYVESSFDDRAPDTGDVQWSPVPVLGYVGAGLALLLGGLGVWWLRLRRHEGGEVPRS